MNIEEMFDYIYKLMKNNELNYIDLDVLQNIDSDSSDNNLINSVIEFLKTHNIKNMALDAFQITKNSKLCLENDIYLTITDDELGECAIVNKIMYIKDLYMISAYENDEYYIATISKFDNEELKNKLLMEMTI